MIPSTLRVSKSSLRAITILFIISYLQFTGCIIFFLFSSIEMLNKIELNCHTEQGVRQRQPPVH